MNKYCDGCGILLQTSDSEKLGYTISIKEKEINYCKRCFRLKHYNEIPKVNATKEDFLRVVDEVLKKNALIVLVVDIFDFEGSFIPKIIEKLRTKNVMLVANKIDILPRSTNLNRVVEWISYMCNKIFFKVDCIHLVSSLKGHYIDELMISINQLRGDKDVYFVGCANVGKSSLINRILKHSDDKTKDIITTSVVPGTTLNAIRIPFFLDNKALVDTPGLINESSLLSKLSSNSYKLLMPNKEIKPITYQLIKENSIIIGGMAVVSLINGENVSFVCYFNSAINLHRCKNENVEELLKNHLGEKFSPPSLDELDNLEYTEEIYELKKDIKHDIVFSGLGFISINKCVTIKVKYLKSTHVNIRKSIIGRKE